MDVHQYQEEVKKLAASLRGNNLAPSDSEARRMAESMLSTQIKVQTDFENKKDAAHMFKDSKPVRPATPPTQSQPARAPQNSFQEHHNSKIQKEMPVNENRALNSNVEQMRQNAIQPKPVVVQSDYDTPLVDKYKGMTISELDNIAENEKRDAAISQTEEVKEEQAEVTQEENSHEEINQEEVLQEEEPAQLEEEDGYEESSGESEQTEETLNTHSNEEEVISNDSEIQEEQELPLTEPLETEESETVLEVVENDEFLGSDLKTTQESEVDLNKQEEPQQVQQSKPVEPPKQELPKVDLGQYFNFNKR